MTEEIKRDQRFDAASAALPSSILALESKRGQLLDDAALESKRSQSVDAAALPSSLLASICVFLEMHEHCQLFAAVCQTWRKAAASRLSWASSQLVVGFADHLRARTTRQRRLCCQTFD